MQLDRVHRAARLVEHLAQDRGEPRGPLGLSVGTEDEILPQFDERVRQAAACPVTVKRIAFQLSRIGNVVADLDSGNGAQRLEQRKGEPRVLVPQHADTPGTVNALPGLREAVDRDDDRRLAERDGLIHGTRDRLVVGLVVGVNAPLQRIGIEPDIARHDETVCDLDHQRRVVEATVGVDQEPREARQDRRRAQALRQTLGDGSGAEIVGDVAMEVLLLQAEAIKGRRDRVLGMVAEDEEASASVAVDSAVGA